MKLCALTQSYAATGGGVRTILHAQQEWCVRHGVHHVLIVPGAEDTTVRDGALTTHTVRSPFVPGSRVYRLLLRSRAVLRLLHAEMPDVTEVHCTYNLPWTALLHRRRHGGRVSAFFNTDVPVAYVETPLRRVAGGTAAGTARRGAERYLRALYDRCDDVIAISPAMLARLEQIGVQGAHMVPLGVDLDTFTPAARDERLRSSFGVSAEDLLLVYAGRLDGEKRPDLVMDALDALPASSRVHLVLAGDGPMREALAGRAAASGRAHVVPFVTERAALARLLASADVYVSAMAHETFGLSVVEAQACGLPVVGVRAGAMTDRVSAEDGVLVEPGSPAAMAAAIVNTPRDAWRGMGRRARARVESEFSWERTFSTLLDIYTRRQ